MDFSGKELFLKGCQIICIYTWIFISFFLLGIAAVWKCSCPIYNIPGQETDWLYSTKNGQNELSEKAGFQRLVIASLNRGHHYEGMEQIQEELSNKVLDLAPNNLPKETKVIYLYYIFIYLVKFTLLYKGAN